MESAVRVKLTKQMLQIRGSSHFTLADIVYNLIPKLNNHLSPFVIGVI